MAAATTPLLAARRLCSDPGGGGALRDVSVDIDPASFNVIVADQPSAAPVLLRVLGLLDRPASGELFVDGIPVDTLSDEERAALRNSRFGYVFAAPFLLSNFTVIENVAIPLFRISRADPPRARAWSEEMLSFVGVKDRSARPVDELSIDQQMRVALARALVNRPEAIFVENLDLLLPKEGWRSFVALLRRARAHFSAAIIAAVSPEFERESDDRQIGLVERGPATGVTIADRSDS